MKKVLILLLTITAFTSCKNESKNESSEINEDGTELQNDGLTLVKGEFVYYADAAVLQTKTEIYGVIINAKVNEINNRAKQYKTEDTDFVMVEVRGEIMPKPEGEEGWENRIEIKEILNVSAVTSNGENVVKLGTN